MNLPSALTTKAENKTENKNIPVSVAVGQIIPEDIADDPAGAEQQTIGNKAIDHCHIQRKAIMHNQQRMQESPDDPPAKKDVAKSADTER